MIRFYAPDIDTTGLLPEGESGHAVRVLRRRPGDEVEAVDGKGTLFRCRLLDDNHRGAAVEIVERIAMPKVWKPYITVAVLRDPYVHEYSPPEAADPSLFELLCLYPQSHNLYQ